MDAKRISRIALGGGRRISAGRQPEWWYDIVEGLPDPIVKKGFIDVWDKPGLGVTFNVKAAKAHLRDEDRDFFD